MQSRFPGGVTGRLTLGDQWGVLNCAQSKVGLMAKGQPGGGGGRGAGRSGLPFLKRDVTLAEHRLCVSTAVGGLPPNPHSHAESWMILPFTSEEVKA